MTDAARYRRPPFADPRAFRWLVASLVVGIALVASLAVSLGSVSVGIEAVWTGIAGHLGIGGGLADPVANQIVWDIRVPRVLLGMLAGAGLAMCGLVIQAVVRNPLGDPYLIGILPGASLGAVAVIVLGADAVGGLTLPAAAFVGALAAFLVIMALGREQGQLPPARLILAGLAIGYLVSSFTFFLQVVATPNQVQRVLFWSLGSLSGAEWGDLPLVATVVLVGCTLLLVDGHRLNALASGTDLARSLGIDVARYQLVLMALVALISGCLVAIVGGIGFVGLMVPHAARMLVGTDHRRVLVATPLLGALFLPLADIAARLLRAPAELPIGIITAAVGAPFFLWLLLGRRSIRLRRPTWAVRSGRPLLAGPSPVTEPLHDPPVDRPGERRA